MEKKKPDNVVFNDGKFDANTKNYPTTISAPSFAPISIDRSDSIKADKYFSSRLNELKSEYENLVDEYKWSNIIYNALYNFQPILGESYYLYLNNDIFFNKTDYNFDFSVGDNIVVRNRDNTSTVTTVNNPIVIVSVKWRK